MKPVKTIFMFQNGNLAVCDDKGQQIPELQVNALSYLWATFATSKGFNVEGAIVEGELGNMKFVKNGNGWALHAI